MAKKNFPKVDIFDFHTGRDGGNKIDQQAVAATGIALFEHVKAGDVVIKKITDGSTIEDGAKRRVTVTIEMELA